MSIGKTGVGHPGSAEEKLKERYGEQEPTQQVTRDRKVTGRGNSFYFWLRKNKYPQLSIQVMCFNCNNSKKLGGVCIHKRNNSG